MENLNKEKLIDVLKEYSLLSNEQQAKAKKKISTEWRITLTDFKKLIEQDPELWNNINLLKNIHLIMNFNQYQYFEKIAFIDIASEEPVYEYDPKMYKEEKKLYENWDQIQAEYKEQQNMLKNAILSPLASKRIERLKKKFEDISKKVKHYAVYADRLQEQDYYHANPDVIANLQNAIQSSVEFHANQYLPILLEKQPQLICHQPDTNDNYESILIELCTELKDNLVQEHEVQSTYFKELEKDKN